MSSIASENPVNAKVARAELGRPGRPWCSARMSAIKRAMGIRSRYFFLSDVRKWLRAHPEFRLEDVYPKKPQLNANGQASNEAGLSAPSPKAETQSVGEPITNGAWSVTRERINICLHPNVLELGWAVQKKRRIDKLSQLIATLFREEYIRCGRPPIPSEKPFSPTIVETGEEELAPSESHSGH